MKVLYLINYAGKGGSERYVQILAQSFLKRDVEVFFAYNENGPLVKQMKELNIKTYNINMKGPFDLSSAKQLASICKENNIDIIHAQFPRENYIALLSKLFGCKAKVVYTSHININNNLIWKITNFILTKKNSAIIAVCNSVKSLLILNKYPKNKIHVIFNGVKYKENNNTNEVKNNTFVFVTLSRLSKEKGILFLLESIKILSTKTSKPFKLVIAGDGPMEEEAKAYVKNNNLKNYVELLGFCTNTEEILNKGNAFVNSSQSEALSFAILEAMAEGLPVIATNVGGNPDIINKNTNCGLLVTYNKPIEMADAMLTLIEDKGLHNNFSKNSLSAIESIFNIEITLENTYGLYKEVLKL